MTKSELEAAIKARAEILGVESDSLNEQYALITGQSGVDLEEVLTDENADHYAWYIAGGLGFTTEKSGDSSEVTPEVKPEPEPEDDPEEEEEEKKTLE